MRIKRGLNRHKKHKKILKKTKGFRLSYSKLYKRAKEATLHAGEYSFNDRKKRKNQFRRTWIQRINAVLNKSEMKYNTFINLLKVKQIELNRKILADIAINHENVLEEIINKVK